MSPKTRELRDLLVGAMSRLTDKNERAVLAELWAQFARSLENDLRDG